MKWYNGKKGYGFIENENGEKDTFVPRASLSKSQSLHEGDEITFDIVEQEDGRRKAINIRKNPQITPPNARNVYDPTINPNATPSLREINSSKNQKMISEQKDEGKLFILRNELKAKKAVIDQKLHNYADKSKYFGEELDACNQRLQNLKGVFIP